MFCEKNDCVKQIEVASSHSMVIVRQYVHKSNGYAHSYCRTGQMFKGQNVQHFCCSKDCMKDKVIECLNNHEHDSLCYAPLNEVNLHNVVLQENLNCLICNKSLTYEAYRICLCYATPLSHMINDGHTDVGEWCCSLDHAKQIALKTVNEL